MFALAAAALLLTGACKEACLGYVTDARLKATVCGRCFIQGDRGAWAASLGGYPQVPLDQLEDLLKDGDWAVRWGGIKSIAVRTQRTEANVMSDWVDSTTSSKACETVLHVAGVTHRQPVTFMRPQSAAACWERRDATRAGLELWLYATEPAVQRETLMHFATYFEQPLLRVVLDAMKTRGPETDVLSARLLEEDAAPVGRTIMLAAQSSTQDAADVPLVNRLLAVYANEIDAQRAALRSPDATMRRAAIKTLGDLAPLSAAELTTALSDADLANARLAANALARGEGLTVSAYAAAKLDPKTEPPVSIAWVGFIGSAGGADCRRTLERALDDDRLDVTVRAATLPALIECAGKTALGKVSPKLDSALPALRAGATRALALLPRTPEVIPLLARRLTDSNAQVLTIAARAAGATHEKSLLPGVTALLASPDAGVRTTALEAIAALESKTSIEACAKLLHDDPDPQVRTASARTLAALGGTQAVAISSLQR